MDRTTTFQGEVNISHIVEIRAEVRDAAAVCAACERLKLPVPVEGTTRLYSGSVTGLAVQLPGWTYPVVCNLASGELKYDNFSGRWGERCELDRFLQAYAVERAKIEARRKGHSVTEQTLSNGSVKLTVHIGGGT